MAEAERLRQGLLADAGRGDLLKTIVDRGLAAKAVAASSPHVTLDLVDYLRLGAVWGDPAPT